MTGAVEAKGNRNGKGRSKAGTKNTWEVTFVACDLGPNEKNAVKSAKTSSADILDGLVKMIDSGYKISFNYEARNDCVGVYATAPGEDHAAHGLCLSARGPDGAAALRVLLYKHYVMLEEKWTAPVGRDPDNDVWG